MDTHQLEKMKKLTDLRLFGLEVMYDLDELIEEEGKMVEEEHPDNPLHSMYEKYKSEESQDE